MTFKFKIGPKSKETEEEAPERDEESEDEAPEEESQAGDAGRALIKAIRAGDAEAVEEAVRNIVG